MFQYLAECQLRLMSRQNEEYSLIQIGSGGLTSISQSDFLSQYERSWHHHNSSNNNNSSNNSNNNNKLLRLRRGGKLSASAPGSQMKQLCDTRAFFLTPYTTKHSVKQNTPALCKRL